MLKLKEVAIILDTYFEKALRLYTLKEAGDVNTEQKSTVFRRHTDYRARCEF